MILKIEDGTVEVPAKAYLHLNNITEYHIPESVRKIGDEAFSVYTDMTPTLQNFIVDEKNVKRTRYNQTLQD